MEITKGTKDNILSIEWELGEIQERLKGDWATFDVIGMDQHSNEYIGEIQTFISCPEITDVYDVEKVDGAIEKTKQ